MQTSIRTGDGFIRICSTFRYCVLLYHPLYHVCSPGYKGHADLASSSPSSHDTEHNRTEPIYALCRGQSRLTNITDNEGCVRYPTEGNNSSHELTTAMHHLPYTLEGFSLFGERAVWFLTSVRFFAYRRIKPHDPPLVRAPVYSFEF